MNFVLLGAPGAGKGTQASLLAARYGFAHISTGDIFRENIKHSTKIGLEAKKYLDEGKLVPDEVTCAIVRDRLKEEDAKRGFLLDGFPRNLFQAEELEKFSHIDGAIDIIISSELLMDRLCGRRVCRECGESYHVSSLKEALLCKKCGGSLYQRDDDNPETVRLRMETYERETAPLTEYYRKKGKLMIFKSDAPAEVLFEEISKAIDEMRRK